jgi:hypothetical protein
MAFCSYTHEAYFILDNSGKKYGLHRRKDRTLTVSLGSPLTSSRPACTLSTILLTACAYFLPCSPSKTTPECLMMETGCPRDSSMYPRTERCDVKEARICSISGDGGTVEVDAAEDFASGAENIDISVGGLTDI